ncbi:uncharacterized protein [Physcomitrium patens]|uniref:Pseudouridine synthase I TruA alpha/beta domain-containing protein n=1 Tax=Physcomitrium patens TaxID=3218 RepID=A0A2K1KJM1_PHYPA|nr:tRNA pseudouridine synthase A-like [Physcomitrium patens]PNR53977.1 hypothetical protein PHYPA_007653 [Physcomitrium patens]|eukprot:XP_024375810.1 tRNA pseudouridine synthase A-like [Physcomitrella patens]
MTIKDEDMALVGEKKRPRGEDNDAAAMEVEGNENGAISGEKDNDAGEGVEKVEVKRAKTVEAALVASPGVVEVEKIAENDSIEMRAEKNGVVKTGTHIPGGGKTGRKRKVALILAYCGAAYQGMQRNPGAITIEGELEQALFRADAIAECNFGDMRKVDWMRAARTDKGVSAIGQIVSARLVIDPPGLVERVNQHLPKDIRVFGYTRVTSNFNAKQMCDKRRYEYLVPVFAFNPHAHHDRETMQMWSDRKENVRLQRIEKRKALEQKAAGIEVGAADVKDATNGAPQSKALEAEEVKSVEVRVEITSVVKEVVEIEAEGTSNGEEQVPFVFDDAKLERLNEILGKYVGTRNYHNFTARIKPEDPSAKRYIISFTAGKVIEVQGMQFVPCTVVGQSFMLHQIRKMIGTAIAIMRGCVPDSIIDFALQSKNDVNTPMAPELGLFLDECFYSAYNKKFSNSHEKLSQEGYEEQILKFKHEVIYPHIATTEAKDGTMALWLHGLNDRHYPYFATHREGAKL